MPTMLFYFLLACLSV
uniref:Predicted gene, 17622 n=1 Tax=Peromyscus maniculatus bairdii TaxID=230844 RepID=A0A8C8TMT1_PERMB